MRAHAIRKALVIDDDEGIFDSISTVLDDSFDPRIEVIYASTTKDGFAAFFSQGPDLVFLDIHFDEKDVSGIDLLKRIKKVQISENIPFILLSDRESINEQLRDLDEDEMPDDFLAKPLPAIELVAKIRQWDRTLFAERNLISQNEYLERKATKLAKENLSAIQQLGENHSISTMGLFTRGMLTIFADSLLSVRGYAKILKMNSDDLEYQEMITEELSEQLLKSTEVPKRLLSAIRIYFEGSLDGWEIVEIVPIVEGLIDLVSHELKKDGLNILKDFANFGMSRVIPAFLVQTVISLFLVFRNSAIPGSVMTVRSALTEKSFDLLFTFKVKNQSKTILKQYFHSKKTNNDSDTPSPSSSVFALNAACDTALRTNGKVKFDEIDNACCLTLSLPVYREKNVVK